MSHRTIGAGSDLAGVKAVSTTVKPSLPPTPDDYERIAQSVQRISDVGRSLAESGLSRRAVLVLLHDATNVSMRDLKCVLDALPNMATWYLEKAKK
jgi:hypothetical protein